MVARTISKIEKILIDWNTSNEVESYQKCCCLNQIAEFKFAFGLSMEHILLSLLLKFTLLDGHRDEDQALYEKFYSIIETWYSEYESRKSPMDCFVEWKNQNRHCMRGECYEKRIQWLFEKYKTSTLEYKKHYRIANNRFVFDQYDNVLSFFAKEISFDIIVKRVSDFYFFKQGIEIAQFKLALEVDKCNDGSEVENDTSIKRYVEYEELGDEMKTWIVKKEYFSAFVKAANEDIYAYIKNQRQNSLWDIVLVVLKYKNIVITGLSKQKFTFLLSFILNVEIDSKSIENSMERCCYTNKDSYKTYSRADKDSKLRQIGDDFLNFIFKYINVNV